MIGRIDDALNRITMYRLALAYCAGVLVLAGLLGFAGLLPEDPAALAFSAVLAIGTCWIANCLFAAVLRVPANAESWLITALILALILPPATSADRRGVAALVLASLIAIASKFLLAPGRKHIFNPVAAGAVAAALVLDHPATWWAGGNLTLLPAVLAGGLLVTRKVQRFDMIAAYILANLAAGALTAPAGMLGMSLGQGLLYSPLLFAGFAMLTEPLTAAHGKWSRLAYGAIVGTLSSPNVHFGGFYPTPEIAFLAGNLFAYAVSPKGRFKLTLLRIERIAAGCYDYVFHADQRLAFQAGQYLDWTLAVPNPDNRGNRRPFTIASAPSAPEVRLGVKFYDAPSTFKLSLSSMRPGDVIYGSQIAGSFTLPRDRTEKLAFIAGGIGITPFRSMIEELLNRGEPRPIVMLYGNNRLDEVAYAGLFERARRHLGLHVVYAVAEPEEPGYDIHQGFIDEALIRREIPDFAERTFYISGPRAMVVRFQHALRDLGVPRWRIRVDYFPGFA
jgi:ferredoxin-NADP reductase/Na+-translocating ferredoxin:NAD+ oxidoreductase RnfD subunit